MNSQPSVFAEAKHHLLPVGLDLAEELANQVAAEPGSLGSTEDPFTCVNMDFDDSLAESRTPPLAKIADFSKFRHFPRVRGRKEKSKLGCGNESDILSGWRQS